MSTPRSISPMLDTFSVGEAISAHNGVVCYPAMQGDQEDRYIVKIISVPSNQVQLTAMLLSGAYATNEDALRYFEDLAKDILQEVRIIGELGNLEGFLPFLDAQMQQKEDGSGYEVYLLSPYRKSLEQCWEEAVMTHKAIADLAMDLCAALAACRRSGYLYVDLKPSNIFLAQQNLFQIGDLGFLPLASLKYASLPEKYHSIYTAPEITDASCEINDTLDVYALGLVLYQAYNGGTLPLEDGKLPETLLPPVYADYEMAEIILKACDPNPAARWEDPTALGQALAQYMQRNPVADEPIIPAPVTTPELDAGEEFLPEEDLSDVEDWEDIPELAFLDSLVAEEAEASDDASEDAGQEDTAQILAQADELIAHALPDPVVAPEAVEISMPAAIVQEAEDTSAPEETEEAVAASEPEFSHSPVQPEVTAVPEKKKKPFWLLPVIVISLLAILLGGGWLYYQNIYLQHIDALTVIGNKTEIAVQITADIDESLLQVSCSDTYGNTFYSDVTDGVAHFKGLAPQTRYTIRVIIDGFHKLTGCITESYTTPNQTNILDFNASIGPVDGSVYLSFTVSGTESDEWIVTYSADGIATQSITFVGHSVTIYDLQIGGDYTFTLSAGDEANIVGVTEVPFTASKIIRAEDPRIVDCSDGALTVQWRTPEGTVVESWIVRCYNAAGYDQTITTSDNTCIFTGLTFDSDCTVEITAAGMNQCVTAQLAANPICITEFDYALDLLYGVQVSWEFTGAQPEGGWLLMWTCDESAAQTVTSTQNNAYIPWIPNGSYTVSLVSADGTAIFRHTFEFTLEEAENFTGFDIAAENLHFMMCVVPQQDNWSKNDVPEEAFKTVFTSEESAGFIIWNDHPVAVSQDVLQIKYVLRDSTGKLLDVSTQSVVWEAMWEENYCELALPFMPTDSGGYTLWIYFDGQLAATQYFSVA